MNNTMEEDVLKELFNMSQGRSIACLSEMVDDVVSVSVPAYRQVQRGVLAARLQEQARCGDGIVGMPFRMAFAESAQVECLLLMSVPQADSAAFMEALFSERIPLETLSDIQAGAMREMGDVFLYTCASSFSHFLESDIEGQPTRLIRSSTDTLIDLLPARPASETAGAEDLFAELVVDFATETRPIRGELSLVLDLLVNAPFKKELERFLQKYAE